MDRQTMLRQAATRSAPWDILIIGGGATGVGVAVDAAILSRRTRALLLNAKAAMRMGPRVAALLAHEIEHDPAWQAQQVAAFTELACGYQTAPDTA